MSEAEQSLKFEITGGYAFAQTFDLINPDAGLFSKAGLLVGSWHWNFEDGTTGSTHLEAATAVRITPKASALMGTMQLNMFELQGTPPGEDLLYLAYEGIDFQFDGSKASFVVEGQFIGGKGKYVNATGHIKVTSVNGFIEKGEGVLHLR